LKQPSVCITARLPREIPGRAVWSNVVSGSGGTRDSGATYAYRQICGSKNAADRPSVGRMWRWRDSKTTPQAPLTLQLDRAAVGSPVKVLRIVRPARSIL